MWLPYPFIIIFVVVIVPTTFVRIPTINNLVEGGGSKLFTKAKKWLYLWTEHAIKVMDILAEASAEYLCG